MKILALEGYYGGSHRAFLDGWVAHSRHDWDVLTLPANKWKWRMRHGAVTFARQVNELFAAGQRWDVMFCSDMLNLAEFLGLVDAGLRQIPVVVYFHENQLTYPVRFESERDYQYVMTNFTTALAADYVWFNTGFHRSEFLSALRGFFKRMPDNQPTDLIDRIDAKSAVHPPGIDSFPRRDKQRVPGPARILWVGRWEHDKNPEDFFQALKHLKEKGIDFRLSVLGEQFRDSPEVFARAKDYFAEHIDRWGYLQSRDEYRRVLCDADIVVSTANHEFFGIGIVEAIAAGACPILPDRLAYPEIVGGIEADGADEPNEFFYDGTVNGLVEKLQSHIASLETEGLRPHETGNGQSAMRLYCWPRRAAAMDDDIERVAG